MLGHIAGLVLAATTVAAAGEVDPRIQRVESGLIPEIYLVGGPTSTIDEELASQSVPGVSVAVIHDFSVAWTSAYGEASRSTGAAATPQTLFPLGDISRWVTSLAVLQLAREGKLVLADPVPAPVAATSLARALFGEDGELTWADLVEGASRPAETSGRGVLADWGPTEPLSRLLGDRREPGSRRRLSGAWGAAMLLQVGLTSRFEESFAEIVDATLAAPLDLGRTIFEQPLQPRPGRQAAEGHWWLGDPLEDPRAEPDLAAMGAWSTSRELAELAVELMRAVRGAPGSRLPAGPTGAADPLSVDRLPWDDDRTRGGHRRLEGGVTGASAVLVIHPHLGHGAVVMANREDAFEFIERVLRSIAVEYDWPDYLPEPEQPLALAPEELARYAGRYHLDEVRVAELVAHDGRLRFADGLDALGQHDFFPLSRTRFVMPANGDWIEFQLDMDRVEGFWTRRVDGVEVVWRKIPEGTFLPLELLTGGRVDEAVQAFRDDPPEGFAMLNEAGYNLLSRLDRPAAALAAHELNAEFFPGSTRAWSALAWSRASTGDLEGAAEAARRSLRLVPEDPALRPDQLADVFRQAVWVAGLVDAEVRATGSTRLQAALDSLVPEITEFVEALAEDAAPPPETDAGHPGDG